MISSDMILIKNPRLVETKIIFYKWFEFLKFILICREIFQNFTLTFWPFLIEKFQCLLIEFIEIHVLNILDSCVINFWSLEIQLLIFGHFDTIVSFWVFLLIFAPFPILNCHFWHMWVEFRTRLNSRKWTGSFTDYGAVILKLIEAQLSWLWNFSTLESCISNVIKEHLNIHRHKIFNNLIEIHGLVVFHLKIFWFER